MLVEENLKGGGFEEVIVHKEALEGCEITIEGECDNIEVQADNVTLIVHV